MVIKIYPPRTDEQPEEDIENQLNISIIVIN